MSNDIPEQALAFTAYEAMAETYASVVDTKPHNAYYERPATLSLLPDVRNRRVLDAGCGPGAYSEWLIKNGASVLGIDASPKMVEFARKRLGDTADLRVADLGKPLSFLDDASFDVVLCPLVLDYIEDWHGAFREFHRVLRSPGHFIFSVPHPFWDFTYFKSENYFATELMGCEWTGLEDIRVHMPEIRRPLFAMINPLLESGFTLEKIVEPKPTEDLRQADPGLFEKLSKQPVFLCVRAKKQ